MAEDRIDIMSHSLAKDTCSDEYPQWLWDKLEWFQDLKFGLFIHWGIYSQWGASNRGHWWRRMSGPGRQD